MTTKLPSFILLVLCVSGVFATDEYVSEIAQECQTKSDFLSCGKYEVTKFIARAARISVPSKMKIIDGFAEFVTMDNRDEPLFPSAARQMSGDSPFRKFAKFIQRQIDAFLGSRAISISLPGQTRIVDADDASNEIVVDDGAVESRGKKKKVNMLIPVVILFKLFKVKIMLALVLFGVLFIKKILMLLLIVGPSYFNMLKICKVPHYTHEVEHEIGGYGHYGGHGPTSYAKDWSNSRAYAAYKPT